MLVSGHSGVASPDWPNSCALGVQHGMALITHFYGIVCAKYVHIDEIAHK
jgi:hypothetical protein